MQKQNKKKQIKQEAVQQSPKEKQVAQKQSSPEQSPTKQQAQEVQQKANNTSLDANKPSSSAMLKSSGLFEAYEYLLKQLVIYGLPKDNLFEFASLQVLKYEKHQKNKFLKAKISQPPKKNIEVQSSFQQAETTRKQLEQQNYLKQLEEIKKNLEQQTMMQKQQLLLQEIATKQKEEAKRSKVQQVQKTQKEVKKASGGQERSKSNIKRDKQQGKNPQAPASDINTQLKSPKTELIRQKNDKKNLSQPSEKLPSKELDKSIKQQAKAADKPQQPQEADKSSKQQTKQQPYARGRKK